MSGGSASECNGVADFYAVDTSVAIPAVDATHEFNAIASVAVLDHKPALAGHAAFEAFAVLTRRLSERLSPARAAWVLERAFPNPCWLTAEGAARLYRLIGEGQVVGGAVYDGLVAQAALDNGRTLLTLDRRARRVYDAVGVAYELIG